MSDQPTVDITNLEGLPQLNLIEAQGHYSRQSGVVIPLVTLQDLENLISAWNSTPGVDFVLYRHPTDGAFFVDREDALNRPCELTIGELADLLGMVPYFEIGHPFPFVTEEAFSEALTMLNTNLVPLMVCD